LIGAGLVAIVAVVVAAIALSGSGGSSSGGGVTGAIAQKEETTPKQPRKPEPKTLTKSELIGRGDAICTDSRETFLGYRGEFPSGESEPSVGYSRLLVGISSNAVNRFNALVPPAGERKAYERYVKSQEEVKGWDQDALKAAEAGDEAAYLAARETRNQTDPERQQLAEAVGFKVCSNSKL
jgi:hypothetical protein